MTKTLDFTREEQKARKMTSEGLRWSARDAAECVRLKIDPEFYADQMSVYLGELRRRKETS